MNIRNNPKEFKFITPAWRKCSPRVGAAFANNFTRRDCQSTCQCIQNLFPFLLCSPFEIFLNTYSYIYYRFCRTTFIEHMWKLHITMNFLQYSEFIEINKIVFKIKVLAIERSTNWKKIELEFRIPTKDKSISYLSYVFLI